MKLSRKATVFLSFSLSSILLCTDVISQPNEVFSPNSNLVVEGVPPIPVSLVKEVDQYSKFRSATFSSWHPTKLQMLIGTRAGDTIQAHQIESPGSTPR